MSERKPKRLDQLFRQGSEQYDFSYNPEAWQQMDALLERERRRRLLLWWGGAVLALLLLGLGYCKLMPWAEVSLGSLPIPRLEAARQSADANEKHERQSNTPLSEISATKALLPKDKAQIPPAAQESSTPLKIQNSHRNAAEPVEEAAASPLVTSEMPLSVQSRLPDAQSIYSTPALESLPALPPASLVPVRDSLEQPLPPPSALNAESQTGAALVLGVTGGLELASVGGDDFQDFNWKIGVHAEYRHGQKYGIGLGVNYLQKAYLAERGEFASPLTWASEPVSTDGVCDMLEIPLLLGYYFRGHQQPGAYAKAGLTSYYMLREAYIYRFEPYAPYPTYEWSTDEGSSHWMGILQLSPGYQWSVGQRQFWQVEPFLQVPLTGVGIGKVDLWSVGLSVKWNWAVKK